MEQLTELAPNNRTRVIGVILRNTKNEALRARVLALLQIEVESQRRWRARVATVGNLD